MTVDLFEPIIIICAGPCFIVIRRNKQRKSPKQGNKFMEGSYICNRLENEELIRALLTLTKGQMILKTITGSILLCALNNIINWK